MWAKLYTENSNLDARRKIYDESKLSFMHRCYVKQQWLYFAACSFY